MTTTPRIFGQNKPSSSTDTNLFTVTTGRSAQISIFIANQSTDYDTFTIAVIPSSQSEQVQNYLAFGTPIIGNGIVSFAGISMNSGDRVQVSSQGGNISFTATGFEYIDAASTAANVMPASSQVSITKPLSNIINSTDIFTNVIMDLSQLGAGFAMRGTLDVWSSNANSAIDSYSSDFIVSYLGNITGSANVAMFTNNVNVTDNISAVISLSDSYDMSGNIVTANLSITITHPIAVDSQSSGTQMTINSNNRHVTAITAS